MHVASEESCDGRRECGVCAKLKGIVSSVVDKFRISKEAYSLCRRLSDLVCIMYVLLLDGAAPQKGHRLYVLDGGPE